MRNQVVKLKGNKSLRDMALSNLAKSTDDWMFFECGETSGTVINAVAGSLVSSLSLGGTLTNAFANYGYITFNGTDMFAGSNSEILRAFCDLSTLNDGEGVLVVASINTSAITSSEIIFSHSIFNTSTGGWGMSLIPNGSTGTVRLQHRTEGGASTDVVAVVANNSLTFNQRVTVGCLITNTTGIAGMNGEASVSGSLNTPIAVCGTNANNGFTIGSAQLNTVLSPYGATTDGLIRDIFFRRYKTVPSQAEFDQILIDFNKSPAQIPLSASL